MSERELTMENFKFADDAPRVDPWNEDDFGYRPFAKRLADVLVQLDAPNGYVIGLHGVWGSGKTSALNFVRHFIRTGADYGDQTKLEVINFQPWMFSGQQDLITAFFRVLAETLKDTAQQVQKARRFLRSAAKVTVDPMVKAAVTMAAAAHPSDTAALTAGGEVVKGAFNQTIDAWLGEPTLQSAHDDLAQRLKKSGRRFLVVIDDIDRLEPTEIKSIMQMVKSVGRLPNVTYLLAYDRRIVWRALAEKDSRKDGEPTFTEKIVQHEIELPNTTRSALLKRLDRELDFVLSHVPSSPRWLELLQHGIHRWITSPRDIVRFSNSVRFTWPPLKQEVDAADVVVMEGLRLFDPSAFDWIRDNRDFLIDGAGYQPDEEKMSFGAAFRERLPVERRADIVSVVATLFPSRAKFLFGKEQFMQDGSWQETIARRGVASPRGYDAYFALFPSPYAVSKAAVDAAVNAADDEAVQTKALQSAIQKVDENGTSLVGEYLDELRYRMAGRNPPKFGKAFVKALVLEGAIIQAQDRDGRTMFPPHIQLQFLVREVLKGQGVDLASDTLVEAITDSRSAALAASLYVWRAREIGLLPAEGAELGAVITAEAFAILGSKTLELIRHEVAEGTLVEAAFYWDIMLAWGQLDSVEVAKSWLMNAAESDPHALAKIAKGILAMSISGGRPVYFLHTLSSDRPFYDVDRLLAASIRFADHGEIDDDERARIIALRDGLIGFQENAARQLSWPDETEPES